MNYLNLNDAGALTTSGKKYGSDAESGVGEAKNFLGKMEGAQSGFKGSAGMTFQGVSSVSAGNLGHLGRQIAEQAKRAVLTEKTAVQGDDESLQQQSGVRTATEGFTHQATKPINV